MYNMHVIYDTTTGIVDKLMPDVGGSLALNVQEGQSSMPWVPAITGIADYSWVEVDGEGNKTLHSAPPKPEHHEWDWATKSWLPNLDAAKAAKKNEVEAELARRLYLPCNDFDADKVSRERISGMIARLQRGDGLPAGWMGWRDASNQQQWATDDAATVLANLASLSRAIEDREQALLIAAWQHKAAIAALSDIDAITGYDVTAGWPT